MSKKKNQKIKVISRKGRKAAVKYVKHQLKNPIIRASAFACYDAAPNEFKEFMRYLFGDKKGSVLINYVRYLTGGDDISEGDDEDEDEENDNEADFASEYPPPVLYPALGRYLENGDIESITITAQLTSPYCEVDDAFTIDKTMMACIDSIDALREVLYNKVALSIATTTSYACTDVSNSNLFGHIKSEYAHMCDRAKSKELYSCVHMSHMIMQTLDCICGGKDTSMYTHCSSMLQSITSSLALYGIKSIEVSYYDINDELVEFKKEFELKSILLPSEVISMMYESTDCTAICTGNIDVSRLSNGDIVVFGTDGEYNVPGNIVRVGRITKIRKQIIEISVPCESEFADPTDPIVETTRKSLAESLIRVLNPRTAVITPKAALYFKDPNLFGALFTLGEKDNSGHAWCNTIQNFINGGYKEETRYAVMNDILEYVNSKSHADISEACVVETDVPAKLVNGCMSVNIIDIQKTALNPTEDEPSGGIMIGGMEVNYGDIVVYGSDAANYGAGDFVRVGRLAKSDKPDTVCIKSPAHPEGLHFNTEAFKRVMFVRAFLGRTVVLTQYQAFVGDGKDELIPSDSTFCDLIKREIEFSSSGTDYFINEVGNRYNIETDDKNIYIVDESAAKRCSVMNNDGTASVIIDAKCITIRNAGE